MSSYSLLKLKSDLYPKHSPKKTHTELLQALYSFIQAIFLPIKRAPKTTARLLEFTGHTLGIHLVKKHNNFKPPEPPKNNLSTTRCMVILLRYLSTSKLQ